MNRKQLVNSILGLFKTFTPKAVLEAALSKATKGELKNIEKKILGDGDPDANTCIPKVGLSKREIFEKAKVHLHLSKLNFKLFITKGSIEQANL